MGHSDRVKSSESKVIPDALIMPENVVPRVDNESPLVVGPNVEMNASVGCQ